MPPSGDHAWVAMPSSAWSLAQRGLREVRVQLDLVDRRHDVGAVDQPAEMLRAEVRDADRSRAAVGEERLGGLVGADRVVEVRRHRLMQQIQVDVVDAQPAQARLEADLRGVVAVVADPQLGADEDLVAGNAGAADALADLALVVVGGGGVDQPVAVTQRRLDRGGGLLGRALEHAQAEGGHRDGVVQRQGRGRCRRHRPVVLSCRAERRLALAGLAAQAPLGRFRRRRPAGQQVERLL